MLFSPEQIKVTEAVFKNEYKAIINNMLKDNTAYQTTDKDPTNTTKNKLRDILNRWVQKGFINQHTKNSLQISISA